jgi:hypothetical protein
MDARFQKCGLKASLRVGEERSMRPSERSPLRNALLKSTWLNGLTMRKR